MLRAWKRAVVPNSHNLRTGYIACSLRGCASCYAVKLEKQKTLLFLAVFLNAMATSFSQKTAFEQTQEYKGIVRRYWNIGLLIPLQKKNLLFWNSEENSELKTFFSDKKSSIQIFHKVKRFFFNSLKYLFSLHSLKLSNKY